MRHYLLTKSELDLLKDRLIQANVKIKEYELMRVVNFDQRSPFSDLINLSEQRNTSLIGYKTMVSVANGWHDANHQFFNTPPPRLYPDVTGRGKKTKWKERWREEAWGEFFLSFWQEVYANYRTAVSHQAGHTLWDVGHSQLTVAVVLAEVQKAFGQPECSGRRLLRRSDQRGTSRLPDRQGSPTRKEVRRSSFHPNSLPLNGVSRA